MIINNRLLVELSAQLGVELNDSIIKKLNQFAEMLVEANKNINLTAITDPDDVTIKHFADSISVFSAFNPAKGARVIDVGTGAGFPGIVMSIVRPDLNITMLDSTNKKLNFVRDVCNELDISAQIIHRRAEEAGQSKGFREVFDLSIARAVADLRVLSEFCLPFVKVGGTFLAMKGTKAEEEIEQGSIAIKTLGGEIKDIHGVNLGEAYMRKLIIIKKISQSPPKYPRSAAQIARKPLE